MNVGLARPAVACASALIAAFATVGPGSADNVTARHEEDGKWLTDEDVPTFKIEENGSVDWYTFSGYRRYHADCHTCHGPDGQGSSYAPAIAKTAASIDYYDFIDVVVNGKREGNLVMPSFGTNLNVMCYLDDIYIYLKAVGSGAIPRGRPPAHADKPASFTEAENACMG